MISNDYLAMMARYSRWQNAALFTAADRLTEADRRLDQAAFWGSIQGTLSHLYWADRLWLSRLGLIDAPPVPQRESAGYIDDYEELKAKRAALDDLLVGWCDAYPAGSVTGSLDWYSGSVGRDVSAPLWIVLTHVFNHQTHHSGQAHAMITAAGGTTTDTDLFLMPRALWPATLGAG